MIAEESVSSPAGPHPSGDKPRLLGLASLFAVLYFSQGVCEPTEGLIAQPTRSLLRNWGYSTGAVTLLMAAIALPWALKPVYGLLTDFVPLAGTRRRSWLLLTTLVASAGLIALYFWAPSAEMAGLMIASLFVPTIAVAFSDVVIDALMVEEGQPRGLTGPLQSVQWTAMWAATVLTGFLGGWLSQRNQQAIGFLIAGLAAAVSLVLAIAVVREPRRSTRFECDGSARKGIKETPTRLDLLNAVRQPAVLVIGAFLFLWNFNPFSTSVLYMHMVEHSGYSEQFFGNTVVVQAVGSMAASLLYGFYCRRFSTLQLVHLSIIAGILATLVYWMLDGTFSAMAISFVVGFAYMTGTMIQLDLAARVCDPFTAGTTFALLMALTNLSVSLSMVVGGRLYEWLSLWKDHRFAFHVLVGVGAIFTSFCWLLIPTIRRFGEPRQLRPS